MAEVQNSVPIPIHAIITALLLKNKADNQYFETDDPNQLLFQPYSKEEGASCEFVSQFASDLRDEIKKLIRRSTNFDKMIKVDFVMDDSKTTIFGDDAPINNEIYLIRVTA